MSVREVLERHRERLLALAGVVGVGIGEGDGEVIELLVEASTDAVYPDEVEGVPVRVRRVGRVKAEDGGLDRAPETEA
ncbi:hypothetical protein ACVNPS_08775 [Candidatus Bipolaricaulota sp. J31]